MRSLSGFEFPDPRVLAARNPWFSEEPYRSCQLSSAQQDRLERTLDDDLPDVMDEVAAELDAEAETMIPGPLPPLTLPPIVRFMNDLMRHFEREVPIPTTSEIPDDAEPRYRRPYSVEH